jgi:hypothetical protein
MLSSVIQKVLIVDFFAVEAPGMWEDSIIRNLVIEEFLKAKAAAVVSGVHKAHCQSDNNVWALGRDEHKSKFSGEAAKILRNATKQAEWKQAERRMAGQERPRLNSPPRGNVSLAIAIFPKGIEIDKTQMWKLGIVQT